MIAFLVAAKARLQELGYVIKPLGVGEFSAKKLGLEAIVFAWDNEIRITSATVARDLAGLQGIRSMGSKASGGSLADYTFFTIGHP